MSGRKVSSPLRYPGGKACLSNFISEIANLNDLNGGTYLELYAGGAGAALELLFNGTFNNIHINDFDYHIYSMWYSILNHTDEFIARIRSTEVTIEQWHLQQEVYSLHNNADIIDLGFATFFLNRTNRSGIIYRAGPIGGLNQTGNYGLDVRFNKEDLIKRINRISEYRDQILLTNSDALEIIRNIPDYPNANRLFLYLDPPYYHKGKFLYLNNYANQDHQNLADAIANLNNIHWLISYDNADEIKDMFPNYSKSTFDLNYTLQTKTFGKELLIFSNNLKIPKHITVNNRLSELILI